MRCFPFPSLAGNQNLVKRRFSTTYLALRRESVLRRSKRPLNRLECHATGTTNLPMLDRQLLRTEPERVREGARKKGIEPPIDEWVALDSQRRALLVELEGQQAERNRLSKSIGALMGQGKKDEAETAKVEAKAIGEKITVGEAQEREIDEKLRDLELSFPNLPHESVPVGREESENVVVRTHGEKPAHEFPVKPHWEIAENLGLIDFARGTKISGSGFVVYTGWGARLQRALFNFMVDHQSLRNGYQEIYPPFVVNSDSLVGTGQLPKFGEDLYRMTSDDLWLIPTAEVPVTNLHRDEILDGRELTKKYAAFSGCFRREAGAAGKDTRGIQRIHQFDKVELVKFCKPEDSYEELESLTNDACSILEALGLHYRVTLLCSGEMSFSNAKCYDLEIWSPAMEKYLEVSSCSNFESFQARRANIRFRREPGSAPEFVHILNGSGVACPRLYSVLLETFQQADGSVLLPEVLRPYVGSDRLQA